MQAAVDVGTNTVRLLLGTVDAGRIRPQRYFRRITRLGGQFDSNKGLAPAAMERTLVALRDFAAHIRHAGDVSVIAAGTAVLRKAANGGDFVRRVRDETGLPLEIISGQREARLTASGVLCALDPLPERCLIFDLGGGSTEFILVDSGQVRFHRSYALGVVGLCEEDRFAAARNRRIEGTLEDLARDLAREDLLGELQASGCRLVGTAGTVTTLAALHLEMDDYDWRRVNNLVLDLETLVAWRRRLDALNEKEREALAGMEQGRADLILPGIEFVVSLLERFGKKAVTVSDFGLLEGLLLEGAGAGTGARN